jgi:hypothetical protein
LDDDLVLQVEHVSPISSILLWIIQGK